MVSILDGEELGASELSRRQALLLGATGLASILGASGCGYPRPSFQVAGEDKLDESGTEALSKLLNQRVKAIRGKNEQAFLANLDQTNTEMIAREQRLFKNLSQFQFEDLHFITEKAFGIEEGGVKVFSPVIAVMKITGDDGPGGVAPAEAYQYKVADRGGKQVITDIVPITRANADSIGGATGHIYANAPWHTSDLTVHQARNVHLVGDKTVPDLRAYVDAAKAEVGKVEALWGKRLKFPGYVLFFTRDRAAFKRWYEIGMADNRVEGLETPLQGVRGNGDVYSEQYAGSRILIDLSSIARFGDDPRYVMRHELTHAVTSRAGVVTYDAEWMITPRWAVEGFARWVENLENATRRSRINAEVAQGVRAGKFSGKPPNSKAFYGKNASFNYALGSTVFSYVERIKGRDAAVELYATLIQYEETNGGTPFVDLPIFDGIAERVLGMGGQDFVSQWASHVRKLV